MNIILGIIGALFGVSLLIVLLELRNAPIVPENAPVANGTTPVWELVIADMRDRDNFGREKYGTPLQAFNGRNPVVDAYQEILDLAVYLRQHIEEQAAMKKRIEQLEGRLRALGIDPDEPTHAYENV
jgi:hypothetical protein